MDIFIDQTDWLSENICKFVSSAASSVLVLADHFLSALTQHRICDILLKYTSRILVQSSVQLFIGPSNGWLKVNDKILQFQTFEHSI